MVRLFLSFKETAVISEAVLNEKQLLNRDVEGFAIEVPCSFLILARRY